MVKHIAAQVLYNEGWEQKHIASALKVTEKTVSQWKRKYDWDAKRARQLKLRDSASEQIMSLIDYQLRVLNRIKDKYDETLDDLIDLPGLNKALIQNGQIDALYKMFAAVKGKETTWAVYVRVVRELHEFLAATNMELAKGLTGPSDDFLNAKRKELS